MAALHAFPISTLSRKSGVAIETIRYYERVGLLPKPSRTSGNYRLYEDIDANRLSFVRRARDLGFSLDDIKHLLDLADQKSRSCRRVNEIATEHLTDIRGKLVDLKRMERVLATLVKSCSQGSMPDCPLLETLANP